MSIGRSLIAFAAVTALVVGAGGAEYTRSEGRHGLEKLKAYVVGYLDLNDAQKKEAQAIFAAERRSAAPILQELKQGNVALTAAVKTGSSDEELQKLGDRQGAVVGQLAGIHAKSMSRFYALLTPGQKTKADELASQFLTAKRRWARRAF